jgi:hypothetical protein
MSRWADLPAAGVTGRVAGIALLRRVLVGLADGEPRVQGEVWLADADFDNWPLDDDEVLAGLTRWLRPTGRRLQLIGLEFDAVARKHPRFARWRRDWSHRLSAWRPVEGPLPADLRLLLAPDVAMQWLDARDARLRVVSDAVALRAMHERCADFLQRCEPAWPVTTLGL